jgi:hypothetical protein
LKDIMDSDSSAPSTPAPSVSVAMPKSAPLDSPVARAPGPPVTPTAAPIDTVLAEDATRARPAEASDRNLIFTTLVTDDADITGLVAYSIYKQNKLDWLSAFETAKGRAPNEAELASYIIGEGTPRRLATYRHLAEATLAGNGPEVEGAPRMARGALRDGRGDRTTLTASLVAVYGVIALLFLLGFWLAAHYTMGPR